MTLRSFASGAYGGYAGNATIRSHDIASITKTIPPVPVPQLQALGAAYAGAPRDDTPRTGQLWPRGDW